MVMAGFLKRLTIAEDFANRVTNIHPGLIPAFCGHGFYGHRVHQAVIDYGAKLSGCTIHFADNQYDHGPVILQRAVPVLDDDTADTLAARVFEAECEAYPEAIQLIAEGRVRVEGRKVRVLEPGESVTVIDSRVLINAGDACYLPIDHVNEVPHEVLFFGLHKLAGPLVGLWIGGEFDIAKLELPIFFDVLGERSGNLR